MSRSLADVRTPSLVLDRETFMRNCQAMSLRARRMGVALRPHLKTAKCLEAARISTRSFDGGITVSTLAEARFFAERGVRDVTYAVGLSPEKIPEILSLQATHGASIKVITDNLNVVRAACEIVREGELGFLIEIDTGGGRGGLLPEDPDVVTIGRAIDGSNNLSLVGVLTHAGHAYHAKSVVGIREIAEAERLGAVTAAEALRAGGVDVRVVSVGSTPTIVHAERLDGVTEIRPGVYMFFDLAQLGVGACTMQDIALTVLTTVIGHNRSAERLVIDAGGLALSKDMSAIEFNEEIGYGLLQDIHGKLLPHLNIADVHQEHGLVRSSLGSIQWEDFPIGTKIRVLPNHACMTAAPYSEYQVIGPGTQVLERWEKVTGW